jgi:hypothetical protein
MKRGLYLSLTMRVAANGFLTVPCPVHLDLAGGREIEAVLYLPVDAGRPGGSYSVESVLDGDCDFIPIGVGGGSALVSRCAIRVVELAADGPGAPPYDVYGGSFDIVTLRLDSGREVSGVLRGFAPVDSMRMSDFFNIPGRYLALGTGGTFPRLKSRRPRLVLRIRDALKVAALVKNFLGTDADALCLVPGERLFMRGDSRRSSGAES